MVNLLLIISVLLLVISVVGLIYSFTKKTNKKVWIILLILSLLLTIFMVIARNEYKYTAEENEKFKHTSVDSNGIVKLKEDEYIVGTDVKEGMYDVESLNKFGEVTVTAIEPTMSSTQIIGIEGVKKCRVDLHSGDKVRVSDISKFTPVNDEQYRYEEVSLYPGVWYVGETIAPGRYNIVPTTNSIGDIRVYFKDGYASSQYDIPTKQHDSDYLAEYIMPNYRSVVDEKLGKGQALESINIDLPDGYRINATNMNFKLIPTTE